MKTSRLIPGAALALALVTSVVAVQPAAARDRLSPGAAAALGVLGGLAVGGAIAASQSPAYAAPVYAPPPPPPPAPVYYAPPPPPVYVEQCYTERYSEWVPGWGWESRRRTVCR
ncbi:hypothetical protein [Microvirga thermotolerans]|uniref:Lectin-like protein BA14k n=1 Tax=Microvirga thermotolerans TaxID=2651334 RepID=A0A5P9JVT6_9HYPH|nr:hypothetical protein [Microvirga thermotolerans]QFU16543.1 hypothetical protein GDR74_10050 [Microvirga thermotolerans]